MESKQGAKKIKIGGNRHLLVVADASDTSSAIAREIAGLGYDVDVAESRDEAEQYLAGNSYAAVITAIVSASGQSGMGFLAAIRERHPEIGIIVFADGPESYSLEELLDNGASDCIALPLRRDELAGKISHVLRERKLIKAHKDELQTQTVLNGLLQLSMEDCSFQEMLQRFLVLITSFPRLGLKPQGAVLLVDEHDTEKLVLSAQHNLAPPLLKTCAEVPFGRCLCGRTAASGELLFVSHVDERHENRFEGMVEHGHYCVPIKAADGTLLGVFTLYLPGNYLRNTGVEDTLRAVAAALAGIIRYQRMVRTVADREARYQAITDAALDGIIMMNNQGRINFFNPAAERMFGCPALEAIGQHLQDFLVVSDHTTDDQQTLVRFLDTSQGEKLGRTIEVLGRHRAGHDLPLELSLSSLRHKDAWQAVAIVRDISERKRHEQEKERLTRELQHAYKMEAIGTLAGGIAHDFNNLLSAILGFSELAKEEVPEGSQASDDMDKVIGAARRARDLTRQILAFSRQSEQEKIPVRMQLIIKEAMKLLRSSIPSTISVTMEIDNDCPAILADPGQLHQIIMNLSTNAYYAMKETGGELKVVLRSLVVTQAEADGVVGLAPGDFVQFAVADNGSGIPPDVLPRIFDPFFTTKPQGEGTGMGLAIVHGIVTELGGTVQVHSKIGKGTEFTVLFPVVAGLETSFKQPEPAYGTHGHDQILLVDDESSLLEVCTRNLIKFGYSVTARSSSIEALAAFRAMPDKFGLVLTDQAMPNMTGVDMAKEILKIRALPIILMTGFADAGTPKLAEEVGIAEVLIKPVPLEELNRAILRHLRKSERRTVVSPSMYR